MGAIVFMVLLTPVTQAQAAPSIVYGAPYRHSSVRNLDESTVSGCTNALLHHSHWSPRTGSGGSAQAAVASTCARSLGAVGVSSNAFTRADSYLFVPIRTLPGSATPTTVVVNWTFAFSMAASIHVTGTCPHPVLNSRGDGAQICTIDSQAVLSTWVFLIDLTTGTYYLASNGLAAQAVEVHMTNQTHCAFFNCTFFNVTTGTAMASAGSITYGWWINATLKHKDLYAVGTYIDAYVHSIIYNVPAIGMAGSSASGRVDMSFGSGLGYTLNSITVS
ncbi:MAG: hypothetical protein L3K19_07260 [Thermoplasmata archaeon]|nr:hypothetical protein [Thermoplasmata archaeon]